MNTEPTRVQRVLIGVVALTLLAGVATIGIRASTGAFSNVYELHATFDRTGHNLTPGSSVKVRGIGVGSVHTISLLSDGRADVAIRVRSGVRVPVTAVASVEPLSIFGPQFLDLKPGPDEDTGPFLHAGGHIARTVGPTELTDLLTTAGNLLSAINPDELLTVVHTLAQGVDGLGKDLGRTVDGTSTVANLLASQDGNTRQLLDSLAVLAKTLSARGAEVVATARSLNAVLPDLTVGSDHIGRILDDASQLSKILSTVVSGHVTALNEILAGLSTVAAPIYAQLATLPEFLKATDAFFYTLGAALLRLPGPNGHIIGVLEGNEPLGLCQLIVAAVCPAPPAKGG